MQVNKATIVIAASALALVIAAALFYYACAAQGKSATAVSAPGSEGAYLGLASGYEKAGDLVKARDSYQRVVDLFPASKNVQCAQDAVENINVKMLFSPAPTPGSAPYEVKKGDTLTAIAKKHNTTVELLQRSNNIHGSAISVGQKIKVPTLKFSILVDKSQNVLTLKAGADIFKTYRVATGKPSTTTPVGTFRIVNKIVNPPWYPAGGKMVPAGDPKNLLGTRWLGISKPSYGIHGTVDPASIGTSVTEGCVRLKNSDVEELYAIVPEGTEVTIID